jgi:hypothetical protein
MRWIIAAFLCVVVVVQLQAALRVSANGRYLVDGNDQPFLMVGDAGWSLIVQLSREDADYYLQARKEKGFNTILVNLIDNEFGSNAPANIYGDRPFTGANFSTPNEAYFAHADYIINSAAAKGIVLVLCPVYLGYSPSEGWSAEVNAASTDDMRAWGRFLGNRYKDKDNIIWCIGGDTSPSPYKTKLREVVYGVQEYDDKLWTSHNSDPHLATDYWSDSWMALDNVYTYDPCAVPLFQTGYNRTPTRPVFFMETRYENERYYPSAQELRSQAYYSVLAGGVGHMYGDCPVWHFGSNSGWCGTTNWKGQLGSAGTNGMYFFQKALTTRAWHEFVPDFNHAVMTSGYGSLASWSTDYAATASSAKTIMAYLPSSRAVTINPAGLSGTTIQVWWYDPSSAQVTDAGQFAKSSRTFTPPSNGDWVLVIDDASLNLGPPGQGLPGPLLVAPSNGALHVPRPVDLIWRSYAGATSYQVQVATSAAFSAIIHDVSGTDTTSTPGGLAALETYFWRVKAATSGGESPWSATWSFATKDSVPIRLGSFTGTSQPDGSVLLEWTTSAETDNKGFEVQRSPLDTLSYETLAGSFRAGQGTATGTHSYAFTDTAAYAGVAYYRLRQISLDDSERFYGEVRVEPVPPSAPALVSPPNGDDQLMPGVPLVWAAVSSATSYHVQVSPDSLFALVLVDAVAPDTSQWLAGQAGTVLMPLTSYWWRVAAANAYGEGPFSAVWKFTTHEWLSVEQEPGLPEGYELGQNYPNPFNPSTKIEFQLPGASVVSLKVYNTLGEEILRPIDGMAMSAGRYSLTIDAASLPSGVYLYQLVTPSFSRIRKMAVIK